jgi:Signal transduction histidine kinase
MKSFAARILPDSLPGQILLLLCLGIAVLQGINLFILRNVQDSYARQTNEDRVGMAASRYFLLEPMTPDQRVATVKGIMLSERDETWTVALTLVPEMTPWENQNMEMAAQVKSIFQARFARKGMDAIPKTQVRVFDSLPKGSVEPYLASIFASLADEQFSLLEIAVQLNDGSWMSLVQSMQLNDENIVWIQRLQLAAVAVVFAVILILLLRKVMRPLRQLALAAEQFGTHPEVVRPLPVEGAREVREAALSFNRMRQMISNNLAERDRMLASMAHDLRTPLTRMQLRLDDICDDTVREGFSANCQEVHSIINQGMELARSLQTSEPFIDVDITSFAQSVVDDHVDEGKSVVFSDHLSPDDKKIVATRPLCLKRCVDNLLHNAFRYAGSSELILFSHNGKIAIDVIDHGPGIPESELERVFEPYYRLESSRNRESGGTGLGLSIARNMAFLSNATLTLHNRPEGGLRARVLFT